MFTIKHSIIIALILLLFPSTINFAQENGGLPIYVVEPGENLTEIADKFNISLDALINANNILDLNLISTGTELLIPGLAGVSGVLTTEPTAFGDTYQSLLRKFGLSEATFRLLNTVTSPSEIYAGSTLVLPQSKTQDVVAFKGNIAPMDSLLTLAIKTGENYWKLSNTNHLASHLFLPGEKFFYISDHESRSVISLDSKIEVNPLPISQGHTVVVRIYAQDAELLTGTLGVKQLHFYKDTEGGFFYALDGISAIAEPGLIPLGLTGTVEGHEFVMEQNLLLTSGGYQKEELTVEQTTIEQDVVLEESAQINTILSPNSTEKLWNGEFRFPVDGSLTDDTIGFSSYFGNRRSYNNGSFYGFHGGLDFKVVLMSLNIYAPANGIVVYAGPMDIRGNTTFIDHGQGVYSGYGHQSEIKVSVGDYVEKGQVIGLIGKTGRVTGPHLHWDIWVNGDQVEPFDWIDNVYP